MTRRREILAYGAALSALLAGCTDDGGEEGEADDGNGNGEEPAAPEDDADDEPTDGADDEGDEDEQADEPEDGEEEEEEDEEEGDNTPEDHPAAEGIDDQPTLGDPASAPGTIVEFSDPSCGVCAAFHDGNFQEIESELVEPGDAAVVFRPYPVRDYEISEPGSQALLATHDRDEEAFWELKQFYYDEHGSFGLDDVYDRTAQFLNENTDVDGDAVAEDAESEAYGSELDANLDAGMDAGAGGETPVFYLFREGEFVTEIRGNQNIEVFRTALEL
ncbi:DsbA family protein [Halalkalicoccus tibetensis]|uniref:DsbA family protein n=1 Tax=Halalkalicoccus tibetensis TaxID=175632 RepID=A0ABD5V8P6_9EURY